MIYVKRFIYCLAFVLAAMMLPLEMGFRFILTGKVDLSKSFVDRLSNYEIN